MSALDTPELGAVPTDGGAHAVVPEAAMLSPNQRAWRRFKRHRLGMWSLWIFAAMFVLFAVLFVFTGGQFIGMGLLGEYLGRMYSDVRARPRFFIERVLRSGPPPAPAASVTVDGFNSSTSGQVHS